MCLINTDIFIFFVQLSIKRIGLQMGKDVVLLKTATSQQVDNVILQINIFVISMFIIVGFFFIDKYNS